MWQYLPESSGMDDEAVMTDEAVLDRGSMLTMTLGMLCFRACMMWSCWEGGKLHFRRRVSNVAPVVVAVDLK